MPPRARRSVVTSITGSAVAPQRVKDIASEAFTVHAYQSPVRWTSLHERHVVGAIYEGTVKVQIKLSKLCRHLDDLLRNDQPLALPPVRNERGNADDLQFVFLLERKQLRKARHRPIGIHDLANHRRGLQASHSGKIDARLRVSRSPQHSPILCA